MKFNEFHKLMAYFLKEKNIHKKFRRTDYGYRTYDNTWKLFEDKLRIAHHKTVRCFEHGEYVDKLEETLYSIKEVPGFVKVDFVSRRLIWMI